MVSAARPAANRKDTATMAANSVSFSRLDLRERNTGCRTIADHILRARQASMKRQLAKELTQ